MNKYILVTPVKNEGKNLESLITSVQNQTIKPVLWLIINDGSTDNSHEIITDFANHNSYIHLHNLRGEVRDLTWRYHKIMQYGFNLAINLCEEKNILWNYIGVLDGDIIVKSENYFQFLIDRFNDSISYGILSGQLLSWDGDNYIFEKRDKNKPTGAARLIRKQTLEKINGYPFLPTADGIMLLKSELAGYKNLWFNEITAYQSRLTNSIINPRKLYREKGFIFHFLGYTFFYVLLYSLIKITVKPYFYSILTLYFFMHFKFTGVSRTTDIQVLNYKKSIISSYIRTKLRIKK